MCVCVVKWRLGLRALDYVVRLLFVIDSKGSLCKMGCILWEVFYVDAASSLFKCCQDAVFSLSLSELEHAFSGVEQAGLLDLLLLEFHALVGDAVEVEVFQIQLKQ